VPEDQIAAAAAAERAASEQDGEQTDGVGVWPDNWRAVRLFLAVETQWRVALGFGVSVHSGLDYSGVEAAMRRLKIDDEDGELFADLQEMERAALPILNEAS